MFEYALTSKHMLFPLHLENFASEQTDSLLLASPLRNTSSFLYFLIEAGILQTGRPLLPLKQKLPFHPSFSFEHLQGIPSAKTLGIGDQPSQDKRTKSF